MENEIVKSICSAYEHGAQDFIMGKGNKNPYLSDSDAYDAYNLGFRALNFDIQFEEMINENMVSTNG